MSKIQKTVITILGSFVIFVVVFFDVIFFGEDLLAPLMKSLFG